ncbi:MAG: type I-F CRISPR-associated endoribonuclease Cas6/Csy4 [Rouxiella aceris]|uniref:type I-F CRISPR-associated endoribonuclease Cas6/Csy4 n=1 Tax=Rouxiella aceris TaxID=2703884 RepID=UPI00284269C1|nr:type I-F CRISPR-associated endoribonuclease Cas6/Csy4 [Rouxiella aceris]MDR3433977.1 type I-F CRISPR-associated endoribonuclease Cas6/Csy4 [Rouxiella aceris]
MDSYQDIRILPDPEFGTELLMAALFAKLHRALGQYAAGQLGVSFPRAAKTPGDILRLHGTAAALESFHQHPWLKGLRDHITLSAIAAIPSEVKYRTVSRVQVKSNAERLRRRSVKKGWLSEEQALARIPDQQSQRTSLPFIQMKSLSNGEAFRVFIKQGELLASPTAGEFSAYGLSSTATVPWF